jgi:hypothetical protein
MTDSAAMLQRSDLVKSGIASEIKSNNLTHKSDFKDDKYEINIGKKVIDFSCNEDIFNLTEAVGTKVISNYCIACDKNISKTKPQYCDFCGSRACEKCMYKQREF